jgi:membrane protein DedA with SNARE-associated domain
VVRIASGVFRLSGTGESVDKARDGLLAVMLAGYWLGSWLGYWLGFWLGFW